MGHFTHPILEGLSNIPIKDKGDSMGTYRKPNVDLPVSLHDASVTKMTFRAGDKPLSGELILYFQDGYRALVEKKWTPTGLGEVIFSGID